MVVLVGGGSVINGATPSSLILRQVRVRHPTFNIRYFRILTPVMGRSLQEEGLWVVRRHGHSLIMLRSSLKIDKRHSKLS